jgi:dienelactone hydrolase
MAFHSGLLTSILARSLAAFALFTVNGYAQANPSQVGRLLEPAIQPPEVTAYQLESYLKKKVAALTPTGTPAQLTEEIERTRRRLLNDVVLHGWPSEWVNAPVNVEDLGPLPPGKGYRMRRLRFEIVPGMKSVAIVYEPEGVSGKIPAILNVHGHSGGGVGKAVEYKQKICINQASQGILALSIEWLGAGELSHPHNQHWFARHLDLAGANGVGVFYLTIRKALDYLAQHPMVDVRRLGMTGLSGGGWQTILLGALDERVQVAVPVAGYAPYLYMIARAYEAGDPEQNPTDMFVGMDYSHLTALRAPRPTLLIYNAEDECCWRAPLVKPLLFDSVLPVYRLYGAEERLAWHENAHPGDHNYQLDNRIQSYRFFTKHFGLPGVETEKLVGGELRSAEELKVGLPENNLTILGLARKLTGAIDRPPQSSNDRDLLRKTVRFPAIDVSRALAVGSTKRAGLETISYRFEFNDGLSATGVWLRSYETPQDSPVTIVLNDAGKKASRAEVADGINRNEHVLALDLLFTGDMIPPKSAGLSSSYTQMLEAFGERPLGIEAAQLAAIARWISPAGGTRAVRVETAGIRSQMAALVSAAIAPKAFSIVSVREGMPSLQYLFDVPIEYSKAPDLFCLNLYRHFDVDRLAALAAPTSIIQGYVK